MKKTNVSDGKSISHGSIYKVRAEHMKDSNTAYANKCSKLGRAKIAERSATRDIRNKT